MNAELMSEFKKEEFVEGLTQLGCDSIEKLRKRLPDLRTELNDSETFQKIYEFAYMFAREVCARGKSIHYLQQTEVFNWAAASKTVTADRTHSANTLAC